MNSIAPETPPQADSNESKPPKRGGKRPGAGRKPNLAKRLRQGFSREAIAEAMAGVDVGMVVTSLLKSKRERTKRPAQNVQLSGGVLPRAYDLAAVGVAVR